MQYSTQEDESKITSPNRTQSMITQQNMQIQEMSNYLPGSRGSSMLPFDDR